jgi:hypothetical protein
VASLFPVTNTIREFSNLSLNISNISTNKGYDIIISVGDQWTVLEDDFTGIKVKLPYYLYEIK